MNFDKMASDRKKRYGVGLVGIAFTFIGLYFSTMLGMSLQFDKNPQVWFSPQYYSQFIPFYIAVTLLLSGIFLTAQLAQANFHLAFFGLTASEEIVFSWVGLTSTDLPLSAVIVFFPLSLLALWLGYLNVLNQKKLSALEAIIGIVASTAFILMPRYL